MGVEVSARVSVIMSVILCSKKGVNMSVHTSRCVNMKCGLDVKMCACMCVSVNEHGHEYVA